MPKKEDHLALAEKNQQTLDYLLKEKSNHPEWIATIAFYKAVHLIEALFSIDEVHSNSHNDREERLKRNNKYQKIYKNYHPLQSASLIARYLACNGSLYSSFSVYMTADYVESQLLNHHLKQIQDSVKGFFERKI